MLSPTEQKEQYDLDRLVDEGGPDPAIHNQRRALEEALGGGVDVKTGDKTNKKGSNGEGKTEKDL
ncbi:hypothetical protein HYZ98_05495 [Candidatus Peregrinibacteria bacterium]|nr:hypothetical protein [Candidatus Peregrinibacteria bacterium]